MKHYFRGRILFSYDFGIFPFDKRYDYLEHLLSSLGSVSRITSLQQCESAKHLILPIPFSKANIEPKFFCHILNSNQIIWGGLFPDYITDFCHHHGIYCYDFMENDAVAIYNSIATAEGAICEAIKKSDKNLHNANCLVVGYGRCGKTLAHKLSGLNANVTICSTKDSHISEAYTFGYQVEKTSSLSHIVQNFDYIFNTAPKILFTKEVIANLNSQCIYLELASVPYGIDFNEAKTQNKKAFLCPGLPGIYSPESCAQILFQYIKEAM